MADAVIGLLVENLNSLIQRDFGLIWGVEQDISKLASLLSTIQAVLQDAEMREFAEKSIANWLMKLKDKAYDADDVLDEWLAYAPDSTSALSCLSPNYINLRHRIAKKVKKIITRLDEIAGERLKFHLNSGVVQTAIQFYESRETVSTLTEDVVYGRDADRDMIVNMLLSNVSHVENVSVFSILGIGGLGKTTLAQYVYEDQRVVEHFDVQIWVCVSNDFEVKKLITMMLESLTVRAWDLKDLDPLERKLQEELIGKRFLLVLDDVWNEDLEKWRRLKYLLTCGAKGSSILVTTRLETVASIVGTMLPHRLTFLSEEHCWYLFKGRAFLVGKEENAELVEIGMQIVKKCCGIPLAAKSLGGLLFSKREVNDWMQVRDSEFWELPQAEENYVLPSLRLSYNYLPSNIKQCFAFCSIYPKDYIMDRQELIHLWIANGFVQSDGRMELEDVGNQIFIRLLQSSFFIDVEKDDLGDIKTCKMHDLMHDLACSVSVNECRIVEVGKGDRFPKGIRYRSLVIDSFGKGAEESSHLESLSKSNLVLRTQLLLGHYREYFDYVHLCVKKLHCVRALDLSGTKVKRIPTSVWRMKQLRYLNFSGTKMNSLPERICNLRNLQSLKLRGCYLSKLPERMRKMSSLRHLDIRDCYITEMPTGMGQLTKLQTLSLFMVGMEVGRHITELQGLNLRGEIAIKRLELVRNLQEVKEVNLSTKQNISSLKLSWENGWESGLDITSSDDLQEKVLEGLQPHPSLKELSIQGYNRGANLPSWMGQMQNLIKITLEECKRCDRLPPLWKLPLLKFLKITNMHYVRCLGDDFYDEEDGRGAANVVQGGCWFPSLEKLEIYGMGALEHWSLPSSLEENPGGVVQVLPRLKELIIENCPKLETIPSSPCVQNVKLENCNAMIMRSMANLGPHSLLTLVIRRFKELTFFPAETSLNCSSSLDISYCPKLKSLGGQIKNHTSLTSLKILSCWELYSLSPRKLTSLRKLHIEGSWRLKCLPVLGIQGFDNSLTELKIERCLSLTSVSEGLQYLTSLQKLSIVSCRELKFPMEDNFQHLVSLRSLHFGCLHGLTALPEGIQHLSMLQHLEIENCDNLGNLPEWLLNLTALKSLKLVHCGILSRRCQKKKGRDWRIISRIQRYGRVKLTF